VSTDRPLSKGPVANAVSTGTAGRSTNTEPDAGVIRLHGRKVYGGVTEGEALVTRETISGWGGINPMLGTIIETRHELRGVSFKDKVLVCPGAKGSSGWSAMFHTARLAGTAPKAVIFNEMTTKIALGCVVMRVPSITDLDRDPLELIETGDWVKVDADNGIVEIRKAPAKKAS
jgi:predicted aconitase with swiveling domain